MDSIFDRQLKEWMEGIDQNSLIDHCDFSSHFSLKWGVSYRSKMWPIVCMRTFLGIGSWRKSRTSASLKSCMISSDKSVWIKARRAPKFIHKLEFVQTWQKCPLWEKTVAKSAISVVKTWTVYNDFILLLHSVMPCGTTWTFHNAQ